MSVYLFIVCAVASSASSAAQQWPQDAGGRPPDLRKLPPDVRELFDAGVGSLAEQRKHWETVAIDELTSVNPMLLRRLRSLHATAGKVAKPFWDYQPYHVRAWNSTLWTAWWATPAEALVPFGGFRIDPPPKPDEERHIIRIEALGSRREPHAIDEIYFTAYRLAKRGQWGAGIQYGFGEWPEGIKYGFGSKSRSLHRDVAFDLSFNLRMGEPMADERSRFRLSTDLSGFRCDKIIGGLEYPFLVEPAPAGNSDREIKPWFASAASLRECALKRLDELSPRVEKYILSYRGDGYYRVGHATPSEPAQPQLVLASFAPPPRPGGRPLTMSEKLQVLQEARDELNRRRKLVMDYFREMHAALVETFPLGNCLE
jgi:hypothetical protein